MNVNISFLYYRSISAMFPPFWSMRGRKEKDPHLHNPQTKQAEKNKTSAQKNNSLTNVSTKTSQNLNKLEYFLPFFFI